MSPQSVLKVLSYEAGVRALEAQERAVDQLRAQTGLLLAASSLTASFLGAQTVQHANGLGVLGTLALLSLLASITLCIYVLLPKEGFVFSLSGAGIYEELHEFQDDDDQVRWRLIYWLEDYWVENQKIVDGLSSYFFAAAVTLMLQLIFWSWALASTIS